MLHPRLAIPLWAMRAAFGSSCIGLGLQRFLEAQATLTRGAGLFEMLAGVLILTPLTEAAATVLTGWLVLLAVGALGPKGATLGGLDVLLAATAFALARLTQVNEAEPVGKRPQPATRRPSARAPQRRAAVGMRAPGRAGSPEARPPPP